MAAADETRNFEAFMFILQGQMDSVTVDRRSPVKRRMGVAHRLVCAATNHARCASRHRAGATADQADIEFAAADMPQASKTMGQIHVAMSECERGAISRHANEALAAAMAAPLSARPCSRFSRARFPNSKISQHHPLDFLKSHNRK